MVSLSLPRTLLALGVMGAVSALTGQERCNQIMCIKALRDNDVDTYTIRPVADIPHTEFGWGAVGWGSQMIGSSMVIMWPNADGSFTLSQRQAHAHHMPDVVNEPARLATLETKASFSNSSTTTMSFSMPSNGQNQTSVIWALSRTNPDSTDPNANLMQHTWRGLEFMFLDAPYDGSTANQASPFPVAAKTMTERGRASFILVAHIVCGCIVTMMVLPGGVVIPRITRGLTTSRWWFQFHAINQGITAVALVCAAFGIGLTFGGPLDTKHRKTGVALFALILIQTILGVFSHFYKPGYRMKRYTFETKRGRGPSNFLHVAFGIICVGVGWGAAWTGMTEWFLRGHGKPAYGFRVGWGIIVMLWLLTYIVGIIFFLPRQLRIESRQREIEKRNEDHKVFRGSAVALANQYYHEQRRADGFRPESDYQEWDTYHGHGSTGSDDPYYKDRSKRVSEVPSALSGLSEYSAQSGRPITPLRQPRPAYQQSGRTTPGSSFTDYFGGINDSPPSKYTATVTFPGPPIPPSPSRPEGLDGDFFPRKR